MIFSAMIVSGDNLPSVLGEIANWRQAENMHREIKWTKVKNQYERKYLSLIDLFHRLSQQDRIHFTAVVFDKRKINYKKFHGGSWLRGRYAFFYHLLLEKFCPLATTDNHRLRIFFDDTPYRYPLGEFQTALNTGLCKQYGRTGQIIRSVEPVESKQNDLIQMADVLMGAIGYHYNGNDAMPTACRAKVNVANYLAARVGLSNLKTVTASGENRFEIWLFPLSA